MLKELKGKRTNERSSAFELMYFEKVDFTTTKENLERAERLSKINYLSRLGISKFFMKTKSNLYISYCDYNNIDDDNKYIDVLTPEEISDDNPELVVLNYNKNFDYGEERTYIEVNDEFINNLEKADKLYSYFYAFKDKLRNKAEDLLDDLLRDINETCYFDYNSKIDDFLREKDLFLGFLNNTISEKDIKQKFRDVCLKAIKNSISRCKTIREREKQKQEELKALQEITTTRSFENSEVVFNDKVIKIVDEIDEATNETKYITITLSKSYPILSSVLFIDKEQYDYEKQRDNYLNRSWWNCEEYGVNLKHLDNDNYQRFIKTLLTLKEDVTINKDDKDFKIEFINGRIKVNDKPMNKQYTFKVFNMWKNDTSVDVQNIIETYKMLGFRKQLIVDEIDKVYMGNLGVKKQEVSIPIKFIPINKDDVKVVFCGLESKTTFDVLLKQFVIGNRISSCSINLNEFVGFGFKKEDVLQKLKQLIMIEAI